MEINMIVKMEEMNMKTERVLHFHSKQQQV